MRRGERLVLLLLAAVLSVVVLANDWGVLTPDTKPEFFLDPWRAARDFARPWLASPELGSVNYNVGVTPVAAVFGILDALGLPPWLIQRTWRIALLLIAAWSARALYRDLVAGTRADTSAGRVAAAIAYAANPYVVVGGGTTPTLLPYALLPAIVLALLRAVDRRSSRWSLLAALLLAATSGINAGVVSLLQLIIVLPIAVHVAVTAPDRLRRLGLTLLQTGAAYAVFSLYWLVPALFALARGSSVVASTESLESINVASSFAESLRGLGFWSLYGAGPEGAFLPGQLAYVATPLVVALTFAGPVLAALGARVSVSPARVFATASVLTGVLVMSAPFPFADRSPWGDLVVAVLEGVPGANAFRTLNKAGAVLEVGLALLIGLAVAELVPRLVHVWQRAASGILAAGVVLAATAPAWTGGLFPVTLDLPGYWRQAASEVNALGDDAGRVLIVPGAKLAAYAWGYGGPDELGNSLFRRPNVFRAVTPSSAPEAADLLGEVDQRAYLGSLPPGSFSALARLIGAGVIVGRYDTEPARQAAGAVDQVLGLDRGLAPVRSFGPALPSGQGTVTVRRVRGEAGRAVIPAGGALLVDGGGSVLPAAVDAGVLRGDATMTLAGSLDDRALGAALADGARIVLSDSNGRREWSDQPSRTGALLPASAQDASTRALYTPADQTTATYDGNARLSTSGPGQLFGPFPTGDAALALDNDPSTAWLFGNFGTGVGNALTLHLGEGRRIGPMSVRITNTGGVRVSGLRVTASGPGGTVTRDLTPTEWSAFPARTDLGGALFRSIRVEVTASTGSGQGWSGISEIDIPGVRLTKVARTPTALPRRLTALDPALVSRAPLDVLLERRAGGPDGLSEEEPRLERDITLPDTRSYELSGRVRIARGASDAAIDDLLGVARTVRASGTSRAFGNPRLRGAAALDGTRDDPDLSSGWVPAEPVVGETLTVDMPGQRLRSFTLTQNGDGAVAVTALVSVNDGTPFRVTLKPGTSTVRLPRPIDAATRVRVLLTGVSGPGPVRILDLGLPRIAISEPSGCVSIGGIDGRPLRAALQGPRSVLEAPGAAVAFTGCLAGEQRLAAGLHTIRSVPVAAIDSLTLRGSATGRSTATTAATPRARVTKDSPTRREVTLESDCRPCYFTTGQGHDARWNATRNGTSLGTPIVIEGYAAGWRIEGVAGDRLVATFAPARPAAVAWVVSVLAVLLAAGFVLAPTIRRLDARTRRSAAEVHAAPGADRRGAAPGPATPGPATPGPTTRAEVRAARDRSRRNEARSAAPGRGASALRSSWMSTSSDARWAFPPVFALLVWATVSWPAAVVAFVVALVAAGVPARAPGRGHRFLLDAALVAVALLPFAWYAGPASASPFDDRHITDNWVAHGLAGFAVWVMLAGAFAGGLRARALGIRGSASRAPVERGHPAPHDSSYSE